MKEYSMEPQNSTETTENLPEIEEGLREAGIKLVLAIQDLTVAVTNAQQATSSPEELHGYKQAVVWQEALRQVYMSGPH